MYEPPSVRELSSAQFVHLERLVARERERRTLQQDLIRVDGQLKALETSRPVSPDELKAFYASREKAEAET